MTTAARRRSRARLRLDELLVERGLAPDAERARALVLAREVRVEGAVATRPAEAVAPGVALEVRERPRYVSRGGDKLASVLDRAGLDVRGLRCLDIGASTGGFSDCLLQRGAREVRERTNARNVEPLDPPADLAVVDVSFISLTAVLPAVLRSLRPGGDVLALVKPQFEARREQVQRGGVVHDATVHAEVVGKVAAWALDRGLRVRGVHRSPLTGPAGNREFFLWLRLPAAPVPRGAS
ncbi:MAG: TlyA family RNA methyltransferase [Chloroflexi bacterium]|nr:TlyA family RNA methyltransferase [Chloroflexota bacterium]